MEMSFFPLSVHLSRVGEFLSVPLDHLAISFRWETDPQFLLKTVLPWLPEELQGKLKMSWPPSVG